ncbi:uncharacterized protein LOC111254405 isoform X2 [Varroa destructor]|uniref:Uncharacterized protein n=1 Tax=Varroa destructor TaxID=109461 RepID=A0A7M7KXC5_VARDE|nr:uncharacterized protein LOC111254405 isoform X2 [Varroa destructor]
MNNAVLELYSKEIVEIDKKIEKCLSDIEIILKEDLTSEGAKGDFLQWRLQYDAALIEIESADLVSALRLVLEDFHIRSDRIESIERVLLPLIGYVKSVLCVSPLNSYPASCPFCADYQTPAPTDQESLRLLSAIGQHLEMELLRTCVPVASKCDVVLDEQCVYFNYRQKLALLKSLYDADYVNELHWRLREKQLANFQCTCCGEQCLFCFLEECAKYLALDMALIDSGLFQPLQVCDKQLHSIYHKCILDFIEIILDDKLDDDQLLSTRHTFRCSLRERELGIGSLPQLADEGITQILQDMNWFDNRVKFYLAKYAYGDTHISVDTSWVSQSVRSLVSSLETLVPGVTSAWQHWSVPMADEERFKSVPCAMDGSERIVQIFGLAWDFVLRLRRFAAIVSSRNNSKSLLVSLNHFLHSGVDIVTATCSSIAKRAIINNKTFIAYNSVAYVRIQLEAFQQTDVADLPSGVMSKLSTVEDSLEYHIVCHHVKWASSSARHSLYDFSSIQKPDMDGFTLAPASLHIYMENLCARLSRVLCQIGCQKVVSRVWSELCTMLCATYAQAKPSEQQVALLSRDIDVVLATSFNVLLFACEDVQHVLGALDEGGDPRKLRHVKNIHASCVLLLSTKYLTDSPVDALYQTFKGGLLPDARAPLPGTVWVSHLFQNSINGAGFRLDSAPNILVWILLEMMRVQKNHTFVLCVKAMRAFNHMLSILLVRQGCAVGALNEDEQMRLMDAALSLGTSRPPCESSHSFVGDMIIPIIEKTNSWKALGSDCLNANRPWWYKVLQGRLKPFVRGVVLSVTDLATARIRREAASDSGAELSSASWKSTCERLLGFVGERLDEAAQSRKEVERLVEHIVDHLGLVSRDILICFTAMDDQQAGNVTPLLDSIGLQFLLNTVCDLMKDEKFLQGVYGLSNETINENCRRLCERLQEEVFGEGREREISAAIHQRLLVIKGIIDSARELCPFMAGDALQGDAYVASLELPLSTFDHQIAGQLTADEDVVQLETIRDILRANDEWFRKSLGVDDSLVTFGQPGMTGGRDVTLRARPDPTSRSGEIESGPLRAYVAWRTGCSERFDSVKGFNPQISNVADVLSEFNFAALLKQHPQISSKEQQDVKEVQLLRSLFQLDRIPDEEHWQKSTNI